MLNNWNKPLVGLAAGALLGLLDGISAWFYPEVRYMMHLIVMGSTFKGLVAGLLAGFVARRLQSVPLGILIGLLLGAIVTYPFAAAPTPKGQFFFWEIMLPGMLVGALAGFITQRYGRAPLKAQSAAR